MLLTQSRFKYPVFKDRVFIKFRESLVEIRYRDQGCYITVPPEDQPEIAQFLQLLQIGNLSVEQLSQNCEGLEDQIPVLLSEFDRRGMLHESQEEMPSVVMSGSQFYRELHQFLARLQKTLPPSLYTQRMLDETITRDQLIGYALESYHVTHLCPRLLAPALANYESLNTQKLLQEFFVSELYHDRLLENSLKSVGVNTTQLEQMQPLPMTFSVCSTLAIFARQHPLSFKAALLLFEIHDEAFHDLFKQRCQALELPKEFYAPILLHAQINEEGDHEQITEILLAEVPSVSPEEQLVVKKNIGVLVESMVKRTSEILDYYGNSQNLIPRCFAQVA